MGQERAPRVAHPGMAHARVEISDQTGGVLHPSRMRLELSPHVGIRQQAATVAIALYVRERDDLADRFVAEFWRWEPRTQAAFERLAQKYVLATWAERAPH